jgi:hypothetical protein
VLAALLLYILSLATAGVYSWSSVMPFVVPLPVLLLLLAGGLVAHAVTESPRWLRAPAAITVLVLLGISMAIARGLLFRAGDPTLQYRAHRAFTLSSDVSPVVTAVLAGLAIYLWCLTEMKRVWLNTRFPEEPDWPQTPEFMIFREASSRAARISCSPATQVSLLILPAVGTLAVALLIGKRMASTLEGGVYDWFVGLTMLAILFLCLWTLARFWALWVSVRQMLRAVAWSPVVAALDYLPEKVSQTIGPYFFARKPHSLQLRTVLCHLRRSAGARDCISAYQDVLRRECKTGEFAGPELLSRCIQELATEWEQLPKTWAARSFEVNCPDPPSEAQRKQRETRRTPSVRQRRENTLAVCLVWYIAHWFVQLRNLMIFMSLGSLLLLVAVASYPFQPHRLLTTVPWLLILGIALVVLTVFVQVDRNEVVSRITRTRPNRLSLNRNFLAAVATFVLPLLAVVASQFPEVSGLLSKWMTPLLRSLG